MALEGGEVNAGNVVDYLPVGLYSTSSSIREKNVLSRTFDSQILTLNLLPSTFHPMKCTSAQRRFLRLQQRERRKEHEHPCRATCPPSSCSNDAVDEPTGRPELAQLRGRLRAHKPEPPPGGLGTKQKPSATTGCCVSYNRAALNDQAKTGGSVPSLPAVASITSATRVAACSIKHDWSARDQPQADPAAVASLGGGHEPARAGQAPAVAGHAAGGD